MPFMLDGFPTKITFTLAPNALFYEKEIAPPGVEGGGMIDVTGMRNIAYRTRWHKALKTLSPVNLVLAWDPSFYITVLNTLINVTEIIQVNLPITGRLISFWGFLDDFKPNAHKEGEQPTANAIVIPTMLSGSAAPVETGPQII